MSTAPEIEFEVERNPLTGLRGVFVVIDGERVGEVPRGEIQDADWITQAEAADYCPDAHCDTESCTCPQDDPLAVVEKWHNETHAFAFRFCDEQPCKGLRDEVLV